MARDKAHEEIHLDTVQSPTRGHSKHVELHHDHIAAEALGGTAQELGASYWRSPKFLGTLTATCLAQISGYLGWVLPANTIALVNEAIGPSDNLIWLAVSWTVGFAVGLALVGRLSDIFGRRWFFIACSVLSLLGNVIGAAAQSIEMLIVRLLLDLAHGELLMVLYRLQTLSTAWQHPVNFRSTLSWASWCRTRTVDPSTRSSCLPLCLSLYLVLRLPAVFTRIRVCSGGGRTFSGSL